MVNARVARPGIYIYHEDGEKIRELVPKSTLYDPESLKTLGRVPYTDSHPPELVDENNVDDYQAGDVGSEVTVDDFGFVQVKAAVRQKDAIRNILDEKKDETSPGYYCEVEDESGEHPIYGKYDRVQKDRVYNHLAGVRHARGGSDCSIRTDNDDTPKGPYLSLDSFDDWRVDEKPTFDSSPLVDEDNRQDKDTLKEVFDFESEDSTKSHQVEVSIMDIDQLVDKIDALSEQIEDADEDEEQTLDFLEDVKEALEEKNDLEEKVDALEAKVDVLEEEKEQDDSDNSDEPAFAFDSKEDMLTWQSERENIREVADAFQVDLPEKADNLAMKRQVVKSEYEDKVDEDSTEARVDALFDILEDKADSADLNERKAENQTGNALEADGQSDGDYELQQAWS